MDFLKIIYDHLSISEVADRITDPSCGGIDLFIGTTRDNFEGKKVEQLEYEAYNAMAMKELKKLCNRAREKWNVKHIAIYHRLGIVEIAEASVIIGVSSEHRKEAIESVSFLIDSLKATVPIWKKEIYIGNDSQWKSNKECEWSKDKNVQQDILGAVCPLKIKEEATYENISKQSNFDDKESLHKELFETSSNFVDPSLVQIVASKDEVVHRISAFQKMKRSEIDQVNVREFCVNDMSSLDEGCARTRAVDLKEKGKSTHLKLTNIENDWGPLVEDKSNDIRNSVDSLDSLINSEAMEESNAVAHDQLENNLASKSSISNQDINSNVPFGIKERLLSVENHLNINGPIDPDIYKRIKSLEDRLLYLESVTPEYYHCDRHMENLAMKQELPSSSEKSKELYSTMNEIDERMFYLKSKLKERFSNLMFQTEDKELAE